MQLTAFLDASPSPAWAAHTAGQMLLAAGFTKIQGLVDFSGTGFYVMPHSGMLIAAKLPKVVDPKRTKFRIIAAHTDAPHLRLKPNCATQSEGYALLTSEIYGGVLLYTWFDRDLGLAGEVFFRGTEGIEKKLVKIPEPIATVPSLAIHLQREVNDEGLTPAKNSELNALIALPGREFSFVDFLASRSGLDKESILSYDLSLFDVNPARLLGDNKEILCSARLDNLVSCYTALAALQSAQSDDTISVVMLFDHEEIGSTSEAGAESKFCESFLEAIAQRVGINYSDFQSIISRSVFLSADMAHGLHPNYSEKHDSENRPRLGGGVTLKVNQNRRYATSGFGQAFFQNICRNNQLPSQIYTHRNDLPCGSTIGPVVSAKLGMATIDVGIPMLGMHSIRESCARADVDAYQKFMEYFLAS